MSIVNFKSDGRTTKDEKKFIITKDVETVKALESAGFVFFVKTNDTYYFSYDEKKINRLNFDKLDLAYTDLMTF